MVALPRALVEQVGVPLYVLLRIPGTSTLLERLGRAGLDVLRVPGLIVHFPGVYTLLFSALAGSLPMIGSGARTRPTRRPDTGALTVRGVPRIKSRQVPDRRPGSRRCC